MRLLKRALIRLADLVDDKLFDHRYHRDGLCTRLGCHSWWDL